MTSSEYETKAAELFTQEKIPMELRGPLSYLAYEAGHAYGYNEVWIKLQDFVDSIAKPIQDFERRIRTEERKAFMGISS